jgi:hypothetical protein
MNWITFSSAVTSGPKYDSNHFWAAINFGFTFVMTSTPLHDGQEESVQLGPAVPDNCDTLCHPRARDHGFYRTPRAVVAARGSERA